MKINKKLVIFIPILVAVLVFIGVYLYYYSEDINSLTVTDKNWIEENIQSNEHTNEIKNDIQNSNN